LQVERLAKMRKRMSELDEIERQREMEDRQRKT